MDLDGPKSPESVTSMEIDDDGVSHSHTQPVQTNSFDQVSGHHTFAGSNAPSQSSPPFPEPTNQLGEVGDIHRDHGMAPWHRRDRLPSSHHSRPEAAKSRKRKIMRLSPHADHSDLARDAHSSADASSSSLSRRIRPRLLRTQRDREFTPLLLMSPRLELEEETLTAFPYTPIVTDSDSLRSMVRRHHLPLPTLDEHGPRILQNSYYPPTADDIEALNQGRRQNSASSFEQVAMASTSPKTPTTGSSLSSLSNLSLPRPFEDGPPLPPPLPPATELPFEPARSTSIIKVHERGIDSGPSFPVPSSTRGGLRPSGGAAPFQFHFHFHAHQHAALAVEPAGANHFFDEPMCESPVSFHSGVALSPPRIDPDDIRRVISAPTGCTQRVPVTFRSLPAT